jgi:hypothetical protein
MKQIRILRILGIATILSLLVIAIPAVPALAYSYDIEIDPEEGAIGDEIAIVGDDFSYSTETTEKWAKIYFTDVEVDEGDLIANLDTYELVESEFIGEYDTADEGEFETTFEVPAELTDGADDEVVVPGTYYIFVVIETTLGVSPIRAVAEFTVTGGEISLDIDEGPVDTLVEITGEYFVADEEIEITYHNGSTTVDIAIEDGDDETDSDGEFASIISIPESTAGAHDLTVTVGTTEVEAEFTVEPDILITPQSGEAGTLITVSGTGFSKREEVEIWFNDNIGVATTTTGSTGSFTATFNVPSGLEASIYNVDAEDGTNVARAKFTLTVPPPPPPTTEPTETPTTPTTPPPSTTSLSISQESGPVGTQIVMGGAGFAAGGTITVKYNDEEVAKATADASGVFVATFQVPASRHGANTISVSDGTSTNELTFTVESVPPATPPPLLPEMGVKVKSPILFDWDDATDASSPVTYDLQIATDRNFLASSMVLEKAALAESEYTLTEEEELILAGMETPYYWRIRAVDAAQNEGMWTGTGEFYVTTPFSLPDWAKYTLYGIGGVLLFGIGYWLGRRTAFYY